MVNGIGRSCRMAARSQRIPSYFGALATLTGALAIYDLWRKMRRKPVPPSQRGPFIGTQQPQA